ncbi:MAG: adenylate cyclase, partial [Solirubrobacteraceae bacterium]|nr:adenylate cyclase [Solirubrobacteraceae bacterium]
MIGVVVGIAVGAAALVAQSTHMLERLELASVDLRFKVAGREHPLRRDVVVVGIDVNTLSKLNQRPPIRRLYHAQLIARLVRDRPRAIVYDVQFTERSEPPYEADDDTLVAAVQRATPRVPIVLSTSETFDGGKSLVFGGDDVVRGVGAHTGQASFPNDADGVIRRVTYSWDGLKTMAVATAGLLGDRQPSRSPYGRDGAWIDFVGPPGAIPTYSFIDVRQGHVPAGALRDKVVVVGATAPTFQDLHSVSTSGRERMTGAELQANAIQTALAGAPLRSTPSLVGIGFTLLAALIGGLAMLPLGSARGERFGLKVLFAVGATVGLLAALILLIVLAFRAGHILPFAYPVSAFVLASMLSNVLSFARVVHTRAQAEQRARFARFIPEQALDQVLASTHAQGRLPGTELDATVVFSDMRGSTALAEGLSASQVIELINRYLSEMSEAFLDSGGTVVSYMGDGIMAVFGAPLHQPDHADRALRAARSILGERLDAFNLWIEGTLGLPPVKIGIGLHSGHVASGTVGSDRRLEYACVGDTTNTAARVESLTKQYGTPLLLSAATRDRLASTDDLVEVGTVEVRGRTAPIVLWTLVEPSATDEIPAPDGVSDTPPA